MLQSKNSLKLNSDHVSKNDVMTMEELLDVPEERITEGEWTDADLLEQ